MTARVNARRRALLSVMAIIVVLAGAGRAAIAGPDWELAPPDPRFVERMAGPDLGLPVMPPPADYAHINGTPVGRAPGRAAPLPATYDLRTLGRVTPARDQMSCGLCWAFAAYASLEGGLLPGQSCDFSENHLKNTFGFQGDPCVGGNHHKALAYLARWAGPVSEADDPYVPELGTSPTGVAVRKHLQNVLFLPNRTGPLDGAVIKQAIMAYGPVYCTMTWDSASWNPGTNAFYYGGTRYDNHAVAVVGWDDTFDRRKFARVPSGNGAWICKNSRGSVFGENGFFYLSYYDQAAPCEPTAFCPAEGTNNYSRNYQYDPLGDTGYIGYKTNTAHFANVFSAVATEPIAAASFYAASPGTSYTVRLYTNVVGLPTSGKLASTAGGITPTAGYFTVALPPAVVDAGSLFAVAVEVTTPTTLKPVPIEYFIYGYSHTTANAGESWVSADGAAWTDLTKMIAHANVCVKAFASGATPTALTLADASGLPGEAVDLAARLTRAADLAPLSGRQVRFLMDDLDLGSATTDAAGAARLVYTLPAGLAAGVHPLLARFGGAADLAASQGAAALAVPRAPVLLSLANQAGVPAQSVALSATLTRASGGAAVQGASVVFAVAGSPLGSATTGAGGVAQLAYQIPGSAVAGDVVTTASFGGSADLTPAAAEGRLTVVRGASRVVVPAAAGYVAVGVAVTATLSRGVDGAPLPGEELILAVDGATVGRATTGANGLARWDFTPGEGLRGRSVIVRAAYAGSAGQAPADGAGTLRVAAYDTAVDVPAIQAAAGADVALRAILRRHDGQPLPNAVLTFEAGGVKLGGAGTDNEGVARIAYTVPSGLTSGAVQVRAAYAGDPDHAPSSGTGSLTVGGLATSLMVGYRTVQFGQTVTLGGILTTTADGAPVRGATLSVILDGTGLGSGVTDPTGAAGVRWTPPADLHAGIHTVSVAFAGDAVRAPSSGSGNLLASAADTILTVGSRTAAPSASVAFSALLRHGITGSGLPDKPVTFSVAGVEVGVATTDAAGAAALPFVVPAGQPAGTYPLAAAFAGDAWYNARTGSATLTVLGLVPTEVSLAGASGQPGSTAILSAGLVRAADRVPLADRTVAFTVDGASVGSAVTNPAGQADLAYWVPSAAVPGTAPIRAAFGGDAQYEASSASATLTVTAHATQVAVADVAARTGQPVTLCASLTRSASGAALADRRLDFTVDGSAVGAAVTAASGVAELAFTPPTSLAGGVHTLGAAFAGTTADLPSNGAGRLSLGLADLSYSLACQSGAVGQTIAITSRLRRKADLAPVSGLPIVVRMAGTAIGSVTTGTDGSAVVKWYIPSGTAAGARTVTGEFAGDLAYAPASAASTATILSRAPTLAWVAARTSAAGTAASLVGYLYQILPDGSLPPLGGKTTVWSVDGVVVGPCTSAADGRCSVSFWVPATWAGTGRHTLLLEFAAVNDPVYAGSAGTAQLTVN